MIFYFFIVLYLIFFCQSFLVYHRHRRQQWCAEETVHTQIYKQLNTQRCNVVYRRSVKSFGLNEIDEIQLERCPKLLTSASHLGEATLHSIVFFFFFLKNVIFIKTDRQKAEHFDETKTRCGNFNPLMMTNTHLMT